MSPVTDCAKSRAPKRVHALTNYGNERYYQNFTPLFHGPFWAQVVLSVDGPILSWSIQYILLIPPATASRRRVKTRPAWLEVSDIGPTDSMPWHFQATRFAQDREVAWLHHVIMLGRACRCRKRETVQLSEGVLRESYIGNLNSSKSLIFSHLFLS